MRKYTQAKCSSDLGAVAAHSLTTSEHYVQHASTKTCESVLPERIFTTRDVNEHASATGSLQSQPPPHKIICRLSFAHLQNSIMDRVAGINWREERVRASDGTDLALCVTDLELGTKRDLRSPDTAFYILYFQGNAASIPPRLPDLSSTLSMLKREMTAEQKNIRCTLVCLSYRGYWTSRGRPTENGLRLDSAAAIDWISRRHQEASGDDYRSPQNPAEVVLWGQSIGCGVATNLAAEKAMPRNLRLNSLILETPFTSIRAMLEVLYPQKWLPYKYLWPFLRNHLDSWKNLKFIADRSDTDTSVPEVLIVQAAKDELVPSELSQQLYDRCVELRIPVRRKSVDGAFHNDAMFRTEGKKAVSQFLAQKIRNAGTQESNAMK
ncbi:hypothetical protein FHL15_004042 [Xylaria flabelliformis]|uniref:Peptidase S9 prolyl oligopeptidase catalytic domain-containing protein n=1 Tax=Xylaria flabelliformis TaxID=2512241 RepID=A0A553I465_9PEZI|nr:hypothetical protein FHL15_004042 [Xylaria flabelliformis]